MTDRIECQMFQFLIGRLAVIPHADVGTGQAGFQFLIGRLAAKPSRPGNGGACGFQFLIGRLAVREPPREEQTP